MKKNRLFFYVSLFIITISCTKKSKLSEEEKNVLIGQSCYETMAEGVRINNHLRGKLLQLNQTMNRISTKERKLDNQTNILTKTKAAVELPLFNNLELDKKIRKEIAKPNPRHKTLLNLENDIKAVDADFIKGCKEAITKAIDPCMVDFKDKTAFQHCVKNKLSAQDREVLVDLIGRVSNIHEFEKEVQAK